MSQAVVLSEREVREVQERVLAAGLGFPDIFIKIGSARVWEVCSYSSRGNNVGRGETLEGAVQHLLALNK